MPVDVQELLHHAAASPDEELDVKRLIERGQLRRRRVRTAMAGAVIVALLGGTIAAVALSTGGRATPSVRADQPFVPAGTLTLTKDGVSLQLPDGWVQSAPLPYSEEPREILAAGTGPRPNGLITPLCSPAPNPSDEELGIRNAFVSVREFGPSNQSLVPPRPAQFRIQDAGAGMCPGSEPPGYQMLTFRFADHDRRFLALVVFGPDTPDQRRSEALQILDSLHVGARSSVSSTTVVPVVPVTPLVVPTSPPPTFVGEQDAVAQVFITWLGTKPPLDREKQRALIQDYDSIADAIDAAAAATGGVECYSGRVDGVTIVDPAHADVVYSILCNGQPVVPELTGHAVKVDGRWMVTRDTVCEAITYGPTRCPAA